MSSAPRSAGGRAEESGVGRHEVRRGSPHRTRVQDAAGRGLWRRARSRPRPQERLKSPLGKREIRLRGLCDRGSRSVTTGHEVGRGDSSVARPVPPATTAWGGRSLGMTPSCVRARTRTAHEGEAPPGELREPRAGLIAVPAAGFIPWHRGGRAPTPPPPAARRPERGCAPRIRAPRSPRGRPPRGPPARSRPAPSHPPPPPRRTPAARSFRW